MPKPLTSQITEMVKKKFGEAQRAWNQFKASANTGKKTIPQAVKTVKGSFAKDSMIQKRLKQIYEQK